MGNKIESHKWIYFKEDDDADFVEAPTDLFLENENGQKFKRFYAGQLIPQEVYNQYFSNKPEKVEKKVEEVVLEKDKKVEKAKK